MPERQRFPQEASMFGPWMNLCMLSLECQQVIAMRLAKLAGGGLEAADEAFQMVVEKAHAGANAQWQLWAGATVDTIVMNYRLVVHANIARLNTRTV